MRKTNILYWLFTIILAALMLFSAIPNIMSMPEAVTMFLHLGYPVYLLPFLGAGKLLGAVAILYPGYPSLKEWAYAGFVFDLSGAMYSGIAVGDPPGNWLPILIGFLLIFLSYTYYHKKLKKASSAARNGSYADRPSHQGLNG
jgi:hypothetical protein